MLSGGSLPSSGVLVARPKWLRIPTTQGGIDWPPGPMPALVSCDSDEKSEARRFSQVSKAQLLKRATCMLTATRLTGLGLHVGSRLASLELRPSSSAGLSS